jgi:hypothetical protein
MSELFLIQDINFHNFRSNVNPFTPNATNFLIYFICISLFASSIVDDVTDITGAEGGVDPDDNVEL